MALAFNGGHGGGGGGGGALLTATLTLTDAQIKALPSTPQEIVAAPGGGKITLPLLAFFSVDTSAGAYTNFASHETWDHFSTSIYLAWDALDNFNTATGPAEADTFLGNVGRFVTLVNTVSANLLAVASSVPGVNLPIAPAFGSPASPQFGYTNAALYVVGQNNVVGDFTGGNAANTLNVTVYYVVATP